jgi:hypothetical protein
MNKRSATPLPEASAWEPKYPFDLVVTYEDTETRNHAMQLYDHLAQNLLDDYDFQCTWWRFDLFRNPVLRTQAAEAAAEANMIIICLRSGNTMPPLAKAWIETWLPRRDERKSALVSLVGDVAWNQRDFCDVNVYLHKIARVAKMDYFSHAFELEHQAKRSLPTPETDPRQTNVIQAFPNPFLGRHFTPRWGINE